MSTEIVKKTDGIKIFGFNTGLGKKLTEGFKKYEASLKGKKDVVTKNYKELINQPGNLEFGYQYPDESVFKFEEEYLGDLVLIQEILLRTQLIKALKEQKSFMEIGLYNLLPDYARKSLSGAFCLVVRYKRLHDLFFRAATVREKTVNIWSRLIGTKFGEKVIEDINKKYNLPTIKQLETIVKYSLDTPLCLNIILGKNSLKQFDTYGKLKLPEDKSQYEPGGSNGDISLGAVKALDATMYIDKNGKIMKSGKEYDIVGLSFSSFDESSLSVHETKPNEKMVDIMKQKPNNWMDNSLKWLTDRAFGNEYLPTNDNWNLVWNAQDDNLHNSFNFKLREKLSNSWYNKPILPSFAEKKLNTRQMKLPKGGKKTQKKRHH
jgi:hypothetical protein